MERKFLWILLGMLVLIGLVGGVLVLGGKPAYRGVLYDPVQPAYDFQLYTAGERPVSLHDFRGRAVLLFFGYTSCPDVCPTTLAILRQVSTDLGDQAGKVQVIYVTVDPQRDTPQRVQEYVSAFDPGFTGLSGSLEQLEPVWQAYGVFREVDANSGSAAGYLVAHSARLYLIDADGNLLLSYSYGTAPEDILSDLLLLLRNYE